MGGFLDRVKKKLKHESSSKEAAVQRGSSQPSTNVSQTFSSSSTSKLEGTKTNASVSSIQSQQPATPSKRATSTGAQQSSRDLWAEALQNLTDKDRAVLQLQTSSNVAVRSSTKNDIYGVMALTNTKKEECDEKRWQFKIQGNSVVLREVANRVLGWIDKFRSIGDLVAGIDPVHAGPAWAGIKVFLQFATADQEQMAALLTGTETITYFVSRCKIYEILYVHKGEQHDARDQLITDLVHLYTEILRFLVRANQLYDRNTVARAFSAVLNLDLVQEFSQTCDELERRLEIDASNCERLYNHEAHDYVDTKLRLLKDELSTLRQPILRIDEKVSNLWIQTERSRRVKIQRWISDLAYEKMHNTEKDRRTENTGLWLINRDEYIEWRKSTTSSFLWLYGIPGAGKTVLVSSVVDNLSASLRSQSDDFAFAYIYCKRAFTNRRTTESILRCFTRQLSVNRAGDAIQASVVDLYQAQEQTAFATDELNVLECKSLLLEFTSVYLQTVFVLDALDECEDDTQADLIEFFDEIVNSSPRVVKFFISSRMNDNIRYRFESGPNIGIRATDSQDDIATFVTAKLDECDRSRRYPLSESIRTKITETLLTKSQGMFQWAALQAVQLTKLKFEEDMEERLGKLPGDLKKAYDEIYFDQIQREPRRAAFVNEIFKWLIAAASPLHPSDLLFFASQDPEINDINLITKDVETMLDACANLVVVDKERNVCRFSHLSVEEYLETHVFREASIHSLAAQVCLRLLLSKPFEIPEFRAQIAEPGRVSESQGLDHSQDDPLADWGEGLDGEEFAASQAASKLLPPFRYVVNHWEFHVQECEDDEASPTLIKLLIEFLGSLDNSSPTYRQWIEVRHKTHPGDVQEYLPADVTSLFACFHGFHKILNTLWIKQDFNMFQRNERGLTLLMLAVRSDNVHMCRLLINLGVDINGTWEKAGVYYTALFYAACRANHDMIDLLLNHGAELNPSSDCTAVALHGAAMNDHSATIKFLVERGAMIDQRLHGFGTALTQTVRNEFLTMPWSLNTAKVLLQLGATIKLEDGPGPLHKAATVRARRWISFMLQHGADPNWSSASDPPLLHVIGYAGFHASIDSDVYMAELVTTYGADIDATYEEVGSPLTTASRFGQASIVDSLLKHGADPNADAGIFGTALQAAIGSFQHIESQHHFDPFDRANQIYIVKTLLAKADSRSLNTTGRLHGSALMAAVTADDGDDEIVNLLLDLGADVNLVGGAEYGAALHAALYCSNANRSKLLIDRGADVNLAVPVEESSNHWTPLITASLGVGESDILKKVEFLLSNGANIDQCCYPFGSALHVAIQDDNISLVRLLLDHDADPNVGKGTYCSPLWLALWWGCMDICILLLAAGAEFQQDTSMEPAFVSLMENTPVSLFLDEFGRICFRSEASERTISEPGADYTPYDNIDKQFEENSDTGSLGQRQSPSNNAGKLRSVGTW